MADRVTMISGEPDPETRGPEILRVLWSTERVNGAATGSVVAGGANELLTGVYFTLQAVQAVPVYPPSLRAMAFAMVKLIEETIDPPKPPPASSWITRAAKGEAV